MGNVLWRGDAEAVAQESRATPANVEIDDIFTLTCGETSVSFTATATTVANVTAGLTALWNASTAPELAEITASDETTYLKLLGDTAGVPFTVTATEADGGGNDTQTHTMSTPTAAAGPNCWDTADNWDTGAIPVDDDDIILEDSDVDILYGLDQSAITADSLAIKRSYTGKIGLPVINESGATDYAEYRETKLKISPDVIDIGEGEGDGSALIKLNAGTITTAMTVYYTASADDENHGAVQFIGTHATNTMTVLRGDVGIATRGGETATVATLTVAYLTNKHSDASVECGSGTTITTVTQTGGTTELASNVTTINLSGGTCKIGGTATVTTAYVDGGTFYHKSTGTMTNLYVSASGSADFSRDMGAKTVTNCYVYTGAAISDPNKVVTWTNGIDAVRCDPFGDVQVRLGSNITVTPSAV